MSQDMERELGWEDEIEKDGGDFVLLPTGDYMFTVAKFERARFQGSTKMPACNHAKLEITVHSQEYGNQTVYHSLLLHTKTEGFLSNFFTGIGQKKKGERLRMDWNKVIGARGKLKLEQKSFTGNDGQERTNNEIKTFYDYEDVFGQQQANQQPQQQQQPFPTQQQTQQSGYTPGQF